MSLSNTNMYITCIFLYQCLHGCVRDIINDLTPVAEIYVVVIHAKHMIYMFHMEGLTLDETAWKHMEQICGTQFQEISKYQSL